MAANNRKKGEIAQIKDWLVKLTEEVTLIKTNDIPHLNGKINLILILGTILTGCLVALTVALIQVI